MQKNLLSTYVLLACVILIWSLAWPISKLGLQDMSPMWFSVSRTLIGAIFFFLYLGGQGKLKLPQKKDWPIVLSIGLLQIAAFLTLVNLGLLQVNSGRAAILVYSTPLWVSPIAILIFNEKVNRLKLTGLLLGIIGIVILFNPSSFNWADKKIIMGNGMLILASICWAIVMIQTRYSKWHGDAMALMPWQLVVALIPLCILALLFESHAEIHWTTRLILICLYNGLLATAFGYTAIMMVSKILPVITTSLLLLGVPAIGLIGSVLLLHEHITANLITAMCFILIGLSCVAISDKL